MTPIRSRAIITGNPGDGFNIVGPFGPFEHNKLTDYAEQLDGDWWVIDLIDPDEEES